MEGEALPIRKLADAVREERRAPDDCCYDELCQAVNRLAYGVARRYGFDHDDAEDVAQEMTIRTLRQIHVGEVNASWVRQGTAFLCLDQLRARRSERNALMAWSDEQRRTIGTFVPPLSPAVFDLLAAMKHLPLHDARALIEHFWEGRSWREIDERCDQGERRNQYRAHVAVEMLMVKLGK